MECLIIRHTTTDAQPPTGLVVGQEGLPINEAGRQQAVLLGRELLELGIDVKTEPVAVSNQQRTGQTAEAAGFIDITEYPVLNEVATAHPEATPGLLAQGVIPEEALAAARAIIANPPVEKVLVTHGLVLMALCQVLGQNAWENFIPKNCEIRRLTL